ncbi:hypothetical protein EVAR_46447_1, partial [Eumeta japonica]
AVLVGKLLRLATSGRVPGAVARALRKKSNPGGLFRYVRDGYFFDAPHSVCEISLPFDGIVGRFRITIGDEGKNGFLFKIDCSRTLRDDCSDWKMVLSFETVTLAFMLSSSDLVVILV